MDLIEKYLGEGKRYKKTVSRNTGGFFETKPTGSLISSIEAEKDDPNSDINSLKANKAIANLKRVKREIDKDEFFDLAGKELGIDMIEYIWSTV